MSFDKKTIEKLQPKQSRYYLKADEVRGLFLVVHPTGSKSWLYRRRVNGSAPRTKLIGYVGDVTYQQAVQKATELNLMIGRGENPFEAPKAQLTLRQLFDDYLAGMIKKGRKTSKRRQQDFDRWLGTLADVAIDKITTTDTEALHGRIGKERGKYAANHAVRLARAIIHCANKSEKFAGPDPFQHVSFYGERPRKRALSVEEANRFIDHLFCAPPSDCGDVVLLDLLCGARISHILALRWDEIDWNRGLWTIPETKNGSEQVIPLSPLELQVLRRRWESKHENNCKAYKRIDWQPVFVFPGRGKTYHLVDPRRSWAKLKAELGLTDFHYHDLRRSLGSAMANAQINLATIKDTLGHKSVEVTAKHYAMINSEAILKAKQEVQEQWTSKPNT